MEAQKWIKVFSASELQGGMVVRIVNCKICGRDDQMMLARIDGPHHHRFDDGTPIEVDRNGNPVKCKSDWWDTVVVLPGHRAAGMCTTLCIPEGRLFRLDVGDLSKTGEEKNGRSAGRLRRQGPRAAEGLSMSCVACDSLKAKSKTCWRHPAVAEKPKEKFILSGGKVIGPVSVTPPLGGGSGPVPINHDANLDLLFPQHAGHMKQELPVSTLSFQFGCYCGSVMEYALDAMGKPRVVAHHPGPPCVSCGRLGCLQCPIPHPLPIGTVLRHVIAGQIWHIVGHSRIGPGGANHTPVYDILNPITGGKAWVVCSNVDAGHWVVVP